MSLTLERLYHPDGKHLGALVAGLSGSGKTTAVISTLQQAMKNKKFGLSIQNIIALVTVLSTGIAGWYSFTGRIDGL